MIAQFTFSILLLSVFFYAWTEYRRSPVAAMLSFVAAIAGLYFVWVPAHSTRLAEFVGVGRGADLVLYTWVCISLIILLNLHLKLRTQHELITVLARTIALSNIDLQISAESPRTKGPQAKDAIEPKLDAAKYPAFD